MLHEKPAHLATAFPQADTLQAGHAEEFIPSREARMTVLQSIIAENEGEYLEFESLELYLLTNMEMISVKECWEMAAHQVFTSKGEDLPAFPWALPQES